MTLPVKSASTELTPTKFVLLVEKNPKEREIHSWLLESVGIQVVAEADGLEGLRSFETDPLKWGVVVADCDLPALHVCQMIRRMRELRPLVPVILKHTDHTLTPEQLDDICADSMLANPSPMDFLGQIKEFMAGRICDCVPTRQSREESTRVNEA